MHINDMAISLAAYQTQLIIHGGTWNILDKGSGQPIVFLHNGGGTLWNWAHQLEAFFKQ